jgi:hypothetical protein
MGCTQSIIFLCLNRYATICVSFGLVAAVKFLDERRLVGRSNNLGGAAGKGESLSPSVATIALEVPDREIHWTTRG